MKQISVALAAGLILATLGSTAWAADDFYKHEQLGALKLDMPAARLQVPAECKQPQKNAETMWGADGLYHQTWKYPACGLEIGLSAEKPKGAQSVFSITIKSPSRLRTARGIGLGSSLQQVRQTYAKDLQPSEAGSASLVAGSGYPGMCFQFKAGKLTEIYFGPGPE